MSTSTGYRHRPGVAARPLINYASTFVVFQSQVPFDGASRWACPITISTVVPWRFSLEPAKHQSLSSADLAAKLGFSEDFIAEYEAGHWRFDPAEYVFIARAIGIDPYELLAQAENEVSC